MGTPDRSLLGYRQVKPWKKRDDIEKGFYTMTGVMPRSRPDSQFGRLPKSLEIKRDKGRREMLRPVPSHAGQLPVPAQSEHLGSSELK
jgi:hypothetical protein